ncbi:MAG: hypothetical protein MJ147_09935 [Clostridia bacterium]|nr:hypothetical protein [Clostridia bacterium]
MDIMDLASKGIIKITKNYGKKIAKDHTAPAIEDAEPVVISGAQFNVGFSRDEINPDTSTDKTYWIAGHGSGHKMEGQKTPVYASAVWIDCGGSEGVLWIGADIVGFTGVEVNKVRSMLADFAKETGCKCINISSTHSHSGIDTVGYWGKPNLVSIPSDGKDPQYIDMLMNTMVKVAKEAYANRKAGKLYAGNKELEESLSGRRSPKKKPFKKVTRIRFAPADGSNETWIVNFPAHPNSLGGSNRMLSAEYPYYLREKIMADCGANVLFGIGAIGAVDAPEFDGKQGFEEIKAQGETIADAAMAIDNEVELNPEIKFVQQKFYYPISNNVLTLLAMRKTFNADVYPCEIGEMGLALKSEMTYMNIGGKKLVTFPGEMFQQTVYGGYDSAEESSTGAGPEINPTPISEIAGDPDLLVFGVTNDMTGYVVPPNDFVLHKTQPYLNKAYDRFNRDHYHETNSMGIESQKILADTFTKLVEKIG